MLELLLLFENTKVTNLTEKRVEENKTKYLSGQSLKSNRLLWFLRRMKWFLLLMKTLTLNKFCHDFEIEINKAVIKSGRSKRLKLDVTPK